MLLKNLQLFESMLSKEKAAQYWYRGVSVDNINELDFQPESNFGDKTKALWFTANPDLQQMFQKISNRKGMVFQIKLDSNLNLWNPFDDEDWNKFIDYIKSLKKKSLLAEPHYQNNMTYKNIFDTEKNGKIDLLDRESYITQDVFRSPKYSSDYKKDVYKWHEGQWDAIENIQKYIKKMGYDGAMLHEDDSFTIELFYKKFTIINKWSYDEFSDYLLQKNFKISILPIKFNKPKKTEDEIIDLLLARGIPPFFTTLIDSIFKKDNSLINEFHKRIKALNNDRPNKVKAFIKLCEWAGLEIKKI